MSLCGLTIGCPVLFASVIAPKHDGGSEVKKCKRVNVHTIPHGSIIQMKGTIRDVINEPFAIVSSGQVTAAAVGWI